MSGLDEVPPELVKDVHMTMIHILTNMKNSACSKRHKNVNFE